MQRQEHGPIDCLEQFCAFESVQSRAENIPWKSVHTLWISGTGSKEYSAKSSLFTERLLVFLVSEIQALF